MTMDDWPEVSHMNPSPSNVSATQELVWRQTSVRIANASAESRISRVKFAEFSCPEIRRGQISGKHCVFLFYGGFQQNAVI
jgi:hypothetical protein